MRFRANPVRFRADPIFWPTRQADCDGAIAVRRPAHLLCTGPLLAPLARTAMIRPLAPSHNLNGTVRTDPCGHRHLFSRALFLYFIILVPRVSAWCVCVVCVRGVGACVRVLGHPLRPTVRSMPARHDSLHVSFRSALRFLVAGVRPGQPDGPWTKSWLFKQPDLPQV